MGAATGLVGLLAAVFLVALAAPASAVTTCEKYGTVSVSGGAYIAQNNIWGASTAQCIDVNGTSFEITRSEHSKATNGEPAAYPSFFRGCHWGNCTNGDNLPVPVNGMPSVTSDFSVTPGSGAWNAAYDLWYSSQRTEGANASYEAEMMIWLDSQGVQPGGSMVASDVPIAGATWNVWYADWDWNYIAYVRTSPTHSVDDLDLRAFTQDAVSRGYVQQSWYLLAVEAGFELWQGGAGSTVNDFSVSTDGGGGGDPSPPPPAEDSCQVSYQVANQWNGGFTASITVTNGGQALDSWTLEFDFPAGQQITHGWNADWSQSGSHVTVTNASWNGSLDAGESTTIGFNGTYSGTNPAPSDFTLNGAACNVS